MKHVYNITFHCSKEVSDAVLEYLQAQLIPGWLAYKFWHSPRLLKVNTQQEGVEGYALQFELDDIDLLDTFNEEKDELLIQLVRRYPGHVMPFSTTMEDIQISYGRRRDE